MRDDRLTWIGGFDAARLVRAREVSPVDLVEAALDALDRTEGTINAFVTVVAESALEHARRAERTLMRTRPDDLGPLFGVPITVKDLTPTAGVRTTYGSRAHAEHVPSEDSVPWARLKEAGAILIGKTTTPEFGALGTTESALTGITRNPWNPEYIAGGSSGGAAASVAAGVGALAWGSDGGGSIRVPASVCGVVGLKPSLGRIPAEQAWESASTDGPLTRSVVDSALLLQVTSGPDRRDPLSLPMPDVDFVSAARHPRDLRGLRIAYAPRPAGGPVSREVDAVVREAVALLASHGATVESVELPLPDPVAYFLHYWGPILASMAGDGEDLPHPAMRDLVARAGTPEEYFVAATATRAEISRVYADVFDRHDFLITPTLPVAPFPHPGAAGGNTHVDEHPVAMPAIDFHRFTESPSHAGLPAISVPAGRSAQGLPIGMQIVGDHLDDAGVLSLAAAWEALAPWADQHPPL